ncbi:Ubiquitin carboxyl-terminal hydrolase 5 [Hypsibius exemplaris]|uniref:Ubiquitin carboxyl-terminal hydrolase n=1 Tax=Hypsibius exemplaris TaxID=2072580 RepID=A0A1W0WF38_HYPEX|nr:Ubiquitin carboxyl-terminal hydrolase 5 [Hypsibius exemplaris]
MSKATTDLPAALLALEQNLPNVRVPGAHDKIYKDECVYSFDSPESETGLYICLNTFLGFGRQHVEKHYAKTENAVYLHLKRTKKPIAQSKHDIEGNQLPKRLAIGLEGGFDTREPKFEYDEVWSIVVLPDFLSIPLPYELLPTKIATAVSAIQTFDSARKLEEMTPWDGEQRLASRYAYELMQLENGVRIAPAGWKCENCDLTANLWMNLTDGRVFCGRKNFDGSGGNNHAIDHYNATKYPLAVKLGTITPTGGDVYSYPEDDMVLDPLLADHLAHFGVNIQQMEKTEKNMAEMEVDLNQKYDEWSLIQESDSKLVPLYGPGFTGMINLGNSCYMNSVMQVLFILPDFKEQGLETSSVEGIRPYMFKSLVGKDHPEFGTKRQQDAEEFFRHLMTMIERCDRSGPSATDAFQYKVEERTQCGQSGKVRYTTRGDCVWSVMIPTEAAMNKHELAAYEERKKTALAKGEKADSVDLVRPVISFNSCIQNFASVEDIDDFYSSAVRGKTRATKSTRFVTFPDYLLIQLKKFTVGPDWVPKKLDVSVDMPLTLDIGFLRAYGRKPDEELLPEDDEVPPTPVVRIDESMVQQLMEAGFSKEGCQRAVFHTASSGVETAMNWIMEHMLDEDFNTPFQIPGAKKEVQVSEENIENIMTMGFTREQSIRALENTDNDITRAIDWIFSHADDDVEPAPAAAVPNANGNKPPVPDHNCRDGPGAYRLRAFISHMGTSTACGHYVCHILKDDKWVIYNDEKVALSEKPPKDLGYLYLYERVGN